jgi:hypothetical protein
MSKKILLVSCALVLLFAVVQGCAPSRKYAWGKYDSTLYAHYKNPQDREAYQERLKEIVQIAEAKDSVPPGLYAEYGYALYESGNLPEAIAYFEKEKAKWPESNVFMEKMIRNAKRHQENPMKSSATPPSGAPEAGK